MLFDIHIEHPRSHAFLPFTLMHFTRVLYVILDPDSGEPVGSVADVDELEDGTQFGVVQHFDSPELPTYMWLRGLLLLPLAEAAPHVRNHVRWALRHAPVT
jgi:hypothetical protein